MGPVVMFVAASGAVALAAVCIRADQSQRLSPDDTTPPPTGGPTIAQVPPVGDDSVAAEVTTNTGVADTFDSEELASTDTISSGDTPPTDTTTTDADGDNSDHVERQESDGLTLNNAAVRRRSRVASTRGSGARRPQRAWAKQHGVSVRRRDDYLSADACPAAPSVTFVASSIVGGRDAHIFNQGPHFVVALRRRHHTTAVVRLTPPHADAVNMPVAVQLEPVDTGDTLVVEATDGQAAYRMVDTRVRTALGRLSDCDTVVVHSTWTLGYFTKNTTAEAVDDAIDALGLIEDAAWVLPPKNEPAALVARIPSSRPMLPPDSLTESATLTIVNSDEAPAPDRVADSDTPTDGENPIVARPTQPVDMPTRDIIEYLGSMDLHIVGTDPVEPIATDATLPPPTGVGLRVPRRLEEGPHIFTDHPADTSGDHRGGYDESDTSLVAEDGDTTQPEEKNP